MRFICIFGFLATCVTLWAKEVPLVPKVNIRNAITSEEFARSGLNKLSANELVELSGAIYGWVGQESSQPETFVNVDVDAKTSQNDVSKLSVGSSVFSQQEEQEFGIESLRERDKRKRDGEVQKKIVSSIKGHFKGWGGKRTFELQNGQIWRQVDKSHFSVRLNDPNVEIKKGLFGTYFLSVEGYRSRCKVRRVK